MDRLEEHIRMNRDELDGYKPSPRIWNRIKKDLHKNRMGFRQWLSVAAMLTIIISGSVIMLHNRNSLSGDRAGLGSGTMNVLINPQLKETEIYYNNLVNSLYREATPLLTGNPEIVKELDSDFSHIDSICTEIKKDLKDNVANQEVVEALIQNYKIKIRILEDLLNQLKDKEDNSEKNKSHEL
jgi:hypothetical protein